MPAEFGKVPGRRLRLRLIAATPEVTAAFRDAARACLLYHIAGIGENKASLPGKAFPGEASMAKCHKSAIEHERGKGMML